MEAFATDLLSSRDRRFRTDLGRLVEDVAPLGMLNGLCQTLLKLTIPGVPDLYQGTETWSLRLVDPDNRVTPDFVRAARSLERTRRALERDPAALSGLLTGWQDGRIKQHVTAVALQARRRWPEVFSQGTHTALQVTGGRAGNLVAFARRRGPGWATVLAPRMGASLPGRPGLPLGAEAWGRTAVLLPAGAPSSWIELVSGTGVRVRRRAGRPAILAAEALAATPVGLLVPVP